MVLRGFFFLNFDHTPKASQEHRIYIAWHPPPPPLVCLQASLTMPCKCTKPPLMFSSWGASVLTNHDVVRRMNMQGSLHATAQFVMAHLPPVRQPPPCGFFFTFLDPIPSASLPRAMGFPSYHARLIGLGYISVLAVQDEADCAALGLARARACVRSCCCIPLSPSRTRCWSRCSPCVCFARSWRLV
jgi:hypothetical protein